MEISEIVKKLEKGERIYIAKAEWKSYDGSLVHGSTRHILMTPESTPKFSLSVRENVELGLVRIVEPLYTKVITTSSSSRGNWYCDKGYTIYVHNKPFKVWVRHRGYTGDRRDDYNKIIESKLVTSKEELLKYFE